MSYNDNCIRNNRWKLELVNGTGFLVRAELSKLRGGIVTRVPHTGGDIHGGVFLEADSRNVFSGLGEDAVKEGKGCAHGLIVPAHGGNELVSAVLEFAKGEFNIS